MILSYVKDAKGKLYTLIPSKNLYDMSVVSHVTGIKVEF